MRAALRKFRGAWSERTGRGFGTAQPHEEGLDRGELPQPGATKTAYARRAKASATQDRDFNQENTVSENPQLVRADDRDLIPPGTFHAE